MYGKGGTELATAVRDHPRHVVLFAFVAGLLAAPLGAGWPLGAALTGAVVARRIPLALAAVAAGVAPEPAPGQPLNLNTATLEQLDTLSGVGPATAQKILDAREERGGFGSIEELGEIPGIGDARLATLREEATV